MDRKRSERRSGLPKSPTGIRGLDEITGGGVPSGRPTLVCGSAGSGKTLLAMEFLVRGATEFGEPGVFMMFEENAEELQLNMQSLGFDLKKLLDRKRVRLEHVHIERNEIEETGEYDLGGLFIRLGHAIDSIGAKRVVLDTIEALFAGLPNHAILRAELRRLFRWLKERGVTAIITGERGDGTHTRYGLEEYVADCVIVLDQRMQDQIATRRLRVVKYRGTVHGTNEYPFVIGERGISVLPITSLQLDHRASRQRLPTGITQLDEMLGGKGVFRGSSVLVSGSPGTGKTSIAAAFLLAACRRGERAMLFAYEESSVQVARNMGSIGLDLAEWVEKGLLRILATRPTLHGLEQHLVQMHDAISEFAPSAVAVDPITNLSLARDETDVKPTLMRLIDFIKQRQITALFTSLTHGGATPRDDSNVGVSSLMDTWLQLRNVEFNGERNRLLHVLKSRGMPHSNQVREFVLSDKGISLVDVYVGADRVLTGTARVAQEGLERSASAARRDDHQHRLRQLAAKQRAIAARIEVLRAEADAEAAEVEFAVTKEADRGRIAQRNTEVMAALRGNGRPNHRRTREPR